MRKDKPTADVRRRRMMAFSSDADSEIRFKNAGKLIGAAV